MITAGDPPVRIRKSRLDWLDAQSRGWHQAGIIDESTRERILSGYAAESAERRAMAVLVLIAILLGSVGLLLLIGYNWDAIPRGAKLALLMGSVAAAFTASAVAYGKGREAAGETLAFAGTLLFGLSIFLVAQVLHIQGRDPDAFLWWGIGVFACAALVRSRAIAVEASLIFLLWVFVEGTFAEHTAFTFVLLWPLALLVGYRLESPWTVGVAAFAAGLAAFFNGIALSHSSLFLGTVALTGCAVYAAGRLHRDGTMMRLAWETSGLAILLIVSIPLMITQVHQELSAYTAGAAGIVVAVVAGGVALAGGSWRSRSATDQVVLAAAAAVCVWIALTAPGFVPAGSASARAATVLFSVLTLAIGVGLIRTALTSDRPTDLAYGVLFALVFLIVRWVSVLANLLWSGLILVAAAGGLLLIARLWRGRATAGVAGRVS
ncbi:MAG: hypothetical protein A3H96_27100 [Acidobacteria bacterium RIFCSPLOWO2_02_FULL_67_36]|nr:MAG: hypothetical protein A3H96_27100 [Acidobacteria bacterium RIFCSPLOWO2_02_FULL_67_36]OFW24535.1 MAG: hypothetical protein A3G21_18445 [Acidobacteria bacterium RIFCSPLOWO2_12_FULL_66_21]